jgi:hypothetical protein
MQADYIKTTHLTVQTILQEDEDSSIDEILHCHMNNKNMSPMHISNIKIAVKKR